MSRQTIRKEASQEIIDYNVINFKFIRTKNLPYILVWLLYYAWIVAFATWWTASPLTENVFGTQLRELMHAATLLSSAAFVFIIQKEQFKKIAQISSILIITGMLLFFTVPNPAFQIFTAVISAFAMGCFNICILMPYIFLLNNTEKLYAVVGSNILIQIISLFLEFTTNNTVEQIALFVVLILALCTVAFFKQPSFVAEQQKASELFKPKFHKKTLYLTLSLNCAVAVLCKGVSKGVLNTAVESIGPSVLAGYYAGGLIGCLLYIMVYAFTKKAYIWLGNITFASVSIGLFLNAYVSQIPMFAIPFAILIGLGSTVGMINMYYILGVIGKKYDNIRFIRLYIFFVGIFGGVSGIVTGHMIHNMGAFGFPILASVFSVIVLMAFIFISPAMERANYVNEWGADSHFSEIDNEQLYIFSRYGLSKRETEVCKLLLQGHTLRQISGILSISYPTVNTYCTSIYRKTGINSRIELLQLFKEYTNQ